MVIRSNHPFRIGGQAGRPKVRRVRPEGKLGKAGDGFPVPTTLGEDRTAGKHYGISARQIIFASKGFFRRAQSDAGISALKFAEKKRPARVRWRKPNARQPDAQTGVRLQALSLPSDEGLGRTKRTPPIRRRLAPSSVGSLAMPPGSRLSLRARPLPGVRDGSPPLARAFRSGAAPVQCVGNAAGSSDNPHDDELLGRKHRTTRDRKHPPSDVLGQ